MKFLTGYLWQGTYTEGKEEKNMQDSVLLQQIRYGTHELVFSCVCEGGADGGYVTGQLKNWLRVCSYELLHGKADASEIQKELSGEIARIHTELCQLPQNRTKNDQTVSMAGILAVDQECLLFRSGNSRMYLFNRRFQKTNMRQLLHQEQTGWQVVMGSLQKGVGILAGTEAFCRDVPRESMKQCLAAQEIHREGQIDRRLRELAQECSAWGNVGSYGAVYVKTL